MDDYGGVVFYKEQIEKMVKETNDEGLLDLVYKILLAEIVKK